MRMKNERIWYVVYLCSLQEILNHVIFSFPFFFLYCTHSNTIPITSPSCLIQAITCPISYFCLTGLVFHPSYMHFWLWFLINSWLLTISLFFYSLPGFLGAVFWLCNHFGRYEHPLGLLSILSAFFSIKCYLIWPNDSIYQLTHGLLA